MINNNFKEIWKHLERSKRIALTLHPAPDGDSLGSCTALKYVLERDFKHKVRLISPDLLPENLASLPFVKEIEFGADVSDLNPQDYDVFLFVDYGSLESFSVKKYGYFSLPKEAFIINIDHHVTNNYYGSLNYVDSSQPSLCSLLVEVFRKEGVKFDSELSNRLLVGVCTDSGFFTYDSAPEKALSDAVFLIENGADYLKEILRPILYSQPLKFKKYNALLIDNLRINEELKCGYSHISLHDVQKLELNPAELRLGINELQFISEFDFVFLLMEFENHLRGSFRSKKGVDVSLFAKALGGGGHKAAASFSLPSMSLDSATEKVLETIRKVSVKNN